MLKRLTVLIMVIAGISLLFGGCAKKVENNIEGTWLLETMMAEDTYEEIWDFQSGGTLVKMSEGGTRVDTAYYAIDNELTYAYIKIQESTGNGKMMATNGFFRVDRINDDVLVLTRYMFLDEAVEGSYLRREFTSM
ncbi:MAG: hypothetical protein ACQES0_01950 [Bacteroidota bacterium]